MTLRARLAAVFQAPGGRPRGRRFGLALLVMAVLCVICGPFFIDRMVVNGPQARAGEISFRAWGPLDAPVPLKGEWRAEWLSPAPGGSFLAGVPGPWEGRTVAGRTLTESGAAAYHLRIRGLPADRYLLFVPKIYAGQRVLANGRVAGVVGQFGLTPVATTGEMPAPATIET